MLFVSYAQPLSLAAHTAGAALIEDFNGKEGTLKAEHTKTNSYPKFGILSEGVIFSSKRKEKYAKLLSLLRLGSKLRILLLSLLLKSKILTSLLLLFLPRRNTKQQPRKDTCSYILSFFMKASKR